MLYLEVGEVFLTPAISHLLPVAEALKLTAGRLIVLRNSFCFPSLTTLLSVVDLDRIRIQWCPWIRLRDPDPDQDDKNDPQTWEKSY
jgi:hypothetical protein